MSRVIKTEDAIRCCLGAEARLNGEVTRVVSQFIAALLEGAASGGGIGYEEDEEFGIRLVVTAPEADQSFASAFNPGILGPGVTAGAALFAELLQRSVGAQAPGVVTIADDFARLIGRPVAAPRPTPVPGLAAGAGTALAGGVVVLVTALELASIASTTGALNAVVALSGAIGQATARRNRNHCRECMEAGSLSQGAPRRRMEVRILRRV